ncbi:hypothetical protein PILCRDRAFT_810576, partial [Piloderma croceum F 1598]
MASRQKAFDLVHAIIDKDEKRHSRPNGIGGSVPLSQYPHYTRQQLLVHDGATREECKMKEKIGGQLKPRQPKSSLNRVL